MKRRLGILLPAAAVLAVGHLGHAAESKPNIILILADDLGYETIGTYGGTSYRTLILFTGDNGTDKAIASMCNGRKVKGGKADLTDSGTHVPLIARWSGRTPVGKVSNDLVDFTDFLPTLLDVARVQVPPDPPLDGRSFAPQLVGKPGNPRDWIYCWHFRDGKPDKTGGEWARTQRYKLYRDGALYDITNDVLEQRPLQGDALTPEVVRIRDMLKRVIENHTRPGFYQ